MVWWYELYKSHHAPCSTIYHRTVWDGTSQSRMRIFSPWRLPLLRLDVWWRRQIGLVQHILDNWIYQLDFTVDLFCAGISQSSNEINEKPIINNRECYCTAHYEAKKHEINESLASSSEFHYTTLLEVSLLGCTAARLWHGLWWHGFSWPHGQSKWNSFMSFILNSGLLFVKTHSRHLGLPCHHVLRRLSF